MTINRSSLLLAVYLLCYADAVSHTIWIPPGKAVFIPCRLRALKSENTRWWKDIDADPTWPTSAVALSVWYNGFGEVVHVGEVLRVHLPAFEVSELALTQYAPKATNSKMSITPEYKGWKGGVSQLLKVNNLDSISCNLIQNAALRGAIKNWNFPDRRSIVLNQTHFQFQVYAQPMLVWNYAIAPDLVHPNHNPLVQPTRRWCDSMRNGKWRYKLSVCKEVFHQRQPLIKLSSPTDPIPLVPSSEEGYTELSVIIELSQYSSTLIANPVNGELSAIHAYLKDSLDKTLVESMLTSMISPISEDIPSISTQVRAICPPGSRSIEPPPLLNSLTLDKSNINDNKSDETHPLTKWSIICHPCPDGQAPRTGYSFDDCHQCPRGYYLGNTGWPSSAACLPCTDGFTTVKGGATAVEQCQVDAGAVTRWILGHLAQVWDKTVHAVAGHRGQGTRTRALAYTQKTYWAWLGRTDWRAWIVGSLYLLVVLWLTTLAIFRLHLYAKLTALHHKQYTLLLKAALVGQINLLTRIKQRARHQIKHHLFQPDVSNETLPKSFSMEKVMKAGKK